jgi:hypothetical protein
MLIAWIPLVSALMLLLLLTALKQEPNITSMPRRAQAVGERYRAQGDLLSLALLYESAQAELDYPQVRIFWWELLRGPTSW